MRRISKERQQRIENEQMLCSHPDGCLSFRLGNSEWCDMHRTRMRRNGELGPVGIKQPFDTCQVEGCDRPYKASGMCSLHWDRDNRMSPAGMKTARGKASTLKRNGWTPEEFAVFMYAQNGKCFKCFKSNYEKGDNRDLASDHNHDTNQRRGLLCHTCNTGIGMLGDNVEGLREALRYLEMFE